MYSKPSWFLALLFGLAFSAVSSAADSAELGAKDEPIKLAINEWTGQHITTHIAGQLLSKLGYKVEYVPAGYLAQHTALIQGSLHASLEIWSDRVSDIYFEGLEQRKLTKLGELGMEARQGWLYPKFMEEICPGLPKWEALKDCKDALVTAQTFPNGRIVAYPAEWGEQSPAKIKGLGLEYTAVSAGSEGALVAELRGAKEQKRPLIIEFWQPHAAFAEMDLEWIDLPPYTEECANDPAWGMNRNEVHDCGFEQTTIEKVAWSGMEEKWPAAFELLQELKLGADEQSQMIYQVDEKGLPVEQVAQEWVDKNQSVWSSWING